MLWSAGAHPGTPRRLVCQSARDGGCCSSILVLTGGWQGSGRALATLQGWRRHRKRLCPQPLHVNCALSNSIRRWGWGADGGARHEVLAARMWLHSAPRIAARDVMPWHASPSGYPGFLRPPRPPTVPPVVFWCLSFPALLSHQLPAIIHAFVVRLRRERECGLPWRSQTA